MQNAFIESEKLAATGRMAAAIAHEINNPLEAVTNLAFLIDTNESLDSSAKECAEMLMEEIHRISNVAKRSLTFFRDTGKPARVRCRCNPGQRAGSEHSVVCTEEHFRTAQLYRAFYMFGSSAEMRQVFSNLIRNAIDAIRHGRPNRGAHSHRTATAIGEFLSRITGAAFCLKRASAYSSLS